MARLWDKEHNREASTYGSKTANIAPVINKVSEFTNVSVSSIVRSMGGTRELAKELLRERQYIGATEREIRIAQGNINKWLAYEKGKRGKSAHKPSDVMRSLLNSVAGFSMIANDGFTVVLTGDISVNNYRRSDRSATVDMDYTRNKKITKQDVIDFLEKPSYSILAKAYGVDELSGYGELDVTIE